MTVVGAGGVAITSLVPLKRFTKELNKLATNLQTRVAAKLEDLKANPLPPGLGFEKLKGYTNPDIYTIHVTGNYKISFEVSGSIAYLRRVATHDEIDRAP